MVKILGTKVEFDNALANAGDQLVVVDFTATWCGPCQMIKPIFEALSGEFPDVQFFKVDVDANSETAEAEGISAMPTFKFYKNGKKVDSFSGANKEKLKEYIQKYK